ncbi:MAG: YceI family protein [Casimicrobiaceae bacterium]
MRCATRAGLAVVFLLALRHAAADPVHYRIEPALTSVEFSIVQFGVFVHHGRFARTSGAIVYDAAIPLGNVALDIAATSVTTGWNARDEFIRGEDLFDAERHPVVRFRSTHFEFVADRLVRVDGSLTLHGATRLVSFVILRADCGRETCVAEASATIQRRDFGMDFAWPLIGDDVWLKLRVSAVRE